MPELRYGNNMEDVPSTTHQTLSSGCAQQACRAAVKTTAAHFSRELFHCCKRAAQKYMKCPFTTRTLWTIKSHLATLLDLKWVWGHFWKVILCRQPGRYDEQVCKNSPAYLPRCTTASCLCCAFSLPLPPSLICVMHPAVSNHSLSMTLNLICKCDMWGRSPILCVHCSYTHSALTGCSGSIDTSECDYFHHIT